jgi:hypothetical protein
MIVLSRSKKMAGRFMGFSPHYRLASRDDQHCSSGETNVHGQNIRLRVNATQLEQALRNLDRIGVRLRENPVREVWKFEFQQRAYDLHFYPRRWRQGLRRLWRRGSALLEFVNLQALQRAGIPAPRAVAHLVGFRIKGEPGDALIIEPIAGAVPLDGYLQDAFIRGQPVPNRRDLAEQVVQIVTGIGRAKFRHSGLSLGSFLIADGKVYFGDAHNLRRGGLRTTDLLLRGWWKLNPDVVPPRKNPLSSRLWRDFVRRSRSNNDEFGRFASGEWCGHFGKSARWGVPWSLASRLSITESDWRSAWPTLLARVEADQLEILKRDDSGDVLAGEVALAGRPISVIVKRPRRQRWTQHLLDAVRPSRPQRMWTKAWMLIARNFPCEWPLLVMNRGAVFGYKSDAIIVFERVQGERLDKIDLDAIPQPQRNMLFRRAGRLLREIEQTGLEYLDGKSTNWIVYRDAQRGLMPVLIDLYGVRTLNGYLIARGIQRLLRAMKRHPQYTPADSLALCEGYAPRAVIAEQPSGKPEGQADVRLKSS